MAETDTTMTVGELKQWLTDCNAPDDARIVVADFDNDEPWTRLVPSVTVEATSNGHTTVCINVKT